MVIYFKGSIRLNQTPERIIHPKHFPGQDLKAFTSKIELASVDLISSGYYNNELTFKIVQNASEANAPIGYQMTLEALKKKVQAAINHTISMTARDRDLYFASQNLDLHSVLLAIKLEYSLNNDQGKWTPAKVKTDRRIVPGTYHISDADGDSVKQLINVLSSSQFKNSTKKPNV